MTGVVMRNWRLVYIDVSKALPKNNIKIIKTKKSALSSAGRGNIGASRIPPSVMSFNASAYYPSRPCEVSYMRFALCNQ
jgi:hypothetical protein